MAMGTSFFFLGGRRDSIEYRWVRLYRAVKISDRVTHICVSDLTIIGSDNGLSPGRRQVIIWTNVRILLIGPLGTNFSEILIEIQTCSLKKMHLKVPPAKWRPFCLGLNVLSFKMCGAVWSWPGSHDIFPDWSRSISAARRRNSPGCLLFSHSSHASVDHAVVLWRLIALHRPCDKEMLQS